MDLKPGDKVRINSDLIASDIFRGCGLFVYDVTKGSTAVVVKKLKNTNSESLEYQIRILVPAPLSEDALGPSNCSKNTEINIEENYLELITI